MRPTYLHKKRKTFPSGHKAMLVHHPDFPSNSFLIQFSDTLPLVIFSLPRLPLTCCYGLEQMN